MAAPAPPRQPISIARPPQQPRSAGVLAVPPSNNKGRSPIHPPKVNRAPSSRLKVLVRRLAPGLTECEFYTILDDEWKAGGAKVDWSLYRPGKISREYARTHPFLYDCQRRSSAAKPSRPSRAYMHLLKEQDLILLSDKVRDSSFADAKGTSNDAALIGPPIVEFAPYGRIPSSRIRKDGRQGTIDQDPEFIDFLESLTHPPAKPANPEAGSEKEGKTEEKIVTPLIQYLRDKKANKGKEPTTPAKGGKHARQELKENKSSQGDKKQVAKVSKESSQGEKKVASAAKIEKIARDAVKVANRQAGAGEGKATLAPAPSTSSPASPAQPAAPAPRSERRRERGSVSAAAKILQRDLGIAPAGGRRKRDGALLSNPPLSTQDVKPTPSASNAPAAGSTSASSTAPSTVPPSEHSAPSPKSPAPTPAQPAKPPTGPSAARAPATKPPTPASRPTPPPPAPPAVSPTATQAFLKHANPSQGITEPLLEAAFAAFGAVARVEIDKKKGFAYVDFAQPEGLRKAVAASPVPVAQGAVVVLERKTGASLQNRHGKAGLGPSARGAPPPQPPLTVGGGRGGRGLGRGGRGGRGGGVPGKMAPAKGGMAEAGPSTTGKATEAASAPSKDGPAASGPAPT